MIARENNRGAKGPLHAAGRGSAQLQQQGLFDRDHTFTFSGTSGGAVVQEYVHV